MCFGANVRQRKPGAVAGFIYCLGACCDDDWLVGALVNGCCVGTCIIIGAGLVTDAENVLTTEQQVELASRIDALNKDRNIEFAVLLERQAPKGEYKDYTAKLYVRWGLDALENKRGILLAMSIEGKQAQFEIGPNLEGMFLEDDVNAFYAGMAEHLKSGNYAKALDVVVEKQDKINQEVLL